MITGPAPDRLAILTFCRQIEPVLQEPKQGLADTPQLNDFVEDQLDRFLDPAGGVFLQAIAGFDIANRGGDDKFTPLGFLMARGKRALA